MWGRKNEIYRRNVIAWETRYLERYDPRNENCEVIITSASTNACNWNRQNA